MIFFIFLATDILYFYKKIKFLLFLLRIFVWPNLDYYNNVQCHLKSIQDEDPFYYYTFIIHGKTYDGYGWVVKWNIIILTILEFMKSRFQLSRKSNSEAGHPTECWRRVLLQHQSEWWGQVGSLLSVGGVLSRKQTYFTHGK